MKISIIPDDQVIVVDGQAHFFAFDLDQGIHAVQWDGAKGEIEYKDQRPNSKINDFSDFQPLLQARDADIARIADAQQAAIDAVPLDEVKQAKIFAINAAADAALRYITEQYPDSERLSWDKQEAEARSYLADDTAATPLLSAIASARGISLVDLATTVISKADTFVAASGLIFGQRQKLTDRVESASSKAAVEAIVVQFN